MLCIWEKYIFILLQTLSKYLHCLFRYNSFIWIVDWYSILLHWDSTELFISALLLSIMRKNIQAKPSERRKPECGKHRMPTVTKPFCRNCRCWALLKRKFLVSSEKLSFWWLLPAYYLFLAAMAGIFREVQDTNVFLFIDSLFSEDCVFSSFYPCLWFCLWHGIFR